MKKFKKGFTLIELLAVIIILAIVALIATPIILDVIEDARKSAGLSESNMILSGINNYCATEDVKEQMDESYTSICKKTMTEEEIKKMVNLGNAEILEIEYSDKLTWLKVKSNGHIYTYQNNAMVEGDLEKPAYVVGDLLKVQVSDSETQNIYVLEVKGDEIIGLLDRNLDITQSIASNSSTGIQPMGSGPGNPNDVAWISEEDYNSAGGNWSSDSDKVKNQNLYEFGPVTANKALNERTSSWNKVTKKYLPEAPEILKLTEYYKELEASGETANWESKYFTDFYGFIQENEDVMNCSSGSECRQAITAAGGAKYLLPEWATINLETTGDSSAGYGYWTRTPMNYSVVSNPDYAWCVYVFGFLTYDRVYYSDFVGARPVIHISQSNILSKLDAPEYVNPDDVGGEIGGAS